VQEGTIGRRYARALALAVVGEGKASDKAAQLKKVEEELHALGSAMEAKGDLRESMANPSFSPAQRRAIVKAISEQANLSPETRVILDILVEKERVQQLPSIARAFRSEVDERTGRVRATLTSARPLDDGTKGAIVAALEKRTGKSVLAELNVDPSVIAGVSARIGGIVYDSTVRSQLERLRDNLSS
jgi:F-type H+-transporting ATPase subunit delta